jgi:hypothetical protein
MKHCKERVSYNIFGTSGLDKTSDETAVSLEMSSQ